MTLLLCAAAAWADVDMRLKNTEPFVDSDGTTPLQGTGAGGDFVQLILAGENESPDAPGGDGTPGGDDALLAVANNPTHVGAGVATPDSGRVSQSGMIYGDGLIGTKVYARFWNASSPGLATYYGETAVTNLLAGDAFGIAVLDVVPTTSYARTADTAFASVPTLTEWGMACLVLLVLGYGVRHILVQQRLSGVPARRAG